MIAHRLSTLKNCDYVYKLDKNGISQEKFKDGQNILVVEALAISAPSSQIIS